MLTEPDRVFLEQMRAKHLPGRHDQSTHGRHSAANRARQAAQELEELRESLGRAQQTLTGRSGSLAAADESLVARRLQRLRGDVPPDGSVQYQSQLAKAKTKLAHDRAQVISTVEGIASIDEGFDDPARIARQLDAARKRFDLEDDPRLDSLADAVRSGDLDAVLTAVNDIAAAAGVTRIGGDQRLGPDQIVAFDRNLHESVGGNPRPGQQVLLVRPGYMVPGAERALVFAEVLIAEPDDIARAAAASGKSRKHTPGGHGHDQSRHGRRRGGAVASAARWISPDDAMAMRQRMLADQPWDDNQREALNRYVGSAYAWMNGLLRDDPDAENLLAEENETAERARELIRDAAAGMRPTVEPVKVKRFVAGFESFGLDMSTLTRDEAAEALRGMKGKTVQEPGFLSTSLSERYGNDAWLGRFKIELDVPLGAQGAYLDGDVGFQTEQELLLAPGTRFEILDVVIDPPRNTVKGRVVVE